MRNGFSVEAATLAAVRQAATVRHEMRRGLRGLAAVSTTAPWFGAFGSCIGIVASFNGLGAEESAALARLQWLLGDAMLPFLLGLGIALAAWSIHRYLSGQVAAFDHEMAIACHDLAKVGSR